MQVDPKALEALFEDHYWDSLAGHKPVVMEHVRAVLALADTRPEAGTAGGVRTCYNTGLSCLAGCDGRTCAGANLPLNQWLVTAIAASPAATRGDAVCAICKGEHDNDALSDICRHCEETAPWREPTSAPESARGEAAANEGRLQAALDYLAENKSRSLAFDGKTFCEDDNSDLWIVTEMQGGLNDREWVLLGSGSTPAEALLDALPLAHPASAPAPAEGEAGQKLLDKALIVLGRCHTVLFNMAKENEGAIFNRWPIHHEPLRSDARNLLPLIDEVLGHD
jgi:hypothetical protein